MISIRLLLSFRKLILFLLGASLAATSALANWQRTESGDMKLAIPDAFGTPRDLWLRCIDGGKVRMILSNGAPFSLSVDGASRDYQRAPLAKDDPALQALADGRRVRITTSGSIYSISSTGDPVRQFLATCGSVQMPGRKPFVVSAAPVVLDPDAEAARKAGIAPRPQVWRAATGGGLELISRKTSATNARISCAAGGGAQLVLMVREGLPPGLSPLFVQVDGVEVARQERATEATGGYDVRFDLARTDPLFVALKANKPVVITHGGTRFELADNAVVKTYPAFFASCK